MAASGPVTSVNAANANTFLLLTGCETVNSIGSWSSCQSLTSSGEQPSPAHRCQPKFLELPFEHARRHWHHEQQRTYSPKHHRRHLADRGLDNFGDQAMSRLLILEFFGGTVVGVLAVIAYLTH